MSGVKISELTTTTTQEKNYVPGSIGNTTYKYDLGNFPIAVDSLSQIVSYLESYDKIQYIFFLKKDIALKDLDNPIQLAATTPCSIIFFGARLIMWQSLNLEAQDYVDIYFHNTIVFREAALMFSMVTAATKGISIEITSIDLQKITYDFEALYGGGSFGAVVNQYSSLYIHSDHPEVFYGFSAPGITPGTFQSLPRNKPMGQIIQRMLGYDLSPKLKPNVFHIWDNAIDGGTFAPTLGAELPFVTNEFMGQFTTGSTAPTVTWPNTVTWSGGTPAIAAGKTYQFSIMNNIGLIVEI